MNKEIFKLPLEAFYVENGCLDDAGINTLKTLKSVVLKFWEEKNMTFQFSKVAYRGSDPTVGTIVTITKDGIIYKVTEFQNAWIIDPSILVNCSRSLRSYLEGDCDLSDTDMRTRKFWQQFTYVDCGKLNFLDVLEVFKALN